MTTINDDGLTMTIPTDDKQIRIEVYFSKGEMCERGVALRISPATDSGLHPQTYGKPISLQPMLHKSALALREWSRRILLHSRAIAQLYGKRDGKEIERYIKQF